MKHEAARKLALSLAVAGVVVSSVLEYVHVQTYLDVTADSFCRVDDSLDCGRVALSRFSVFLGIPLPLWGLIGFGSMFAAAWRRSVLLLPLAGFSALASVLLLIEEVAFIGSVCLLCEAVHILALALLVVAWRMPDKQPIDREALWNALAIPAALLLVLRVFVPPYWVFVMWTDGPPAPTGLDADGHHWIGPEDAEHVMHEYIDYACPHCAISSNLMKMKIVEGASVRIVRRNQPRNKCTIHKPQICTAVRAAHCAGAQDKFWEMDSWLFAHVAGKSEFDLSKAAQDLDFDLPTLEACMSSEDTWTWAEAEAENARKMRVLATPLYFVDGLDDQRLEAEQARDLADE